MTTDQSIVRGRNVVVVGTQWGDEGKGKLVDVLSERADCVVRYQGGANAGHTVVIGEEQFILQQLVEFKLQLVLKWRQLAHG